MSWFQRRAQAESDRAALAAAIQQLHLRLEQLEMRFDDARAEAAARQDAWRALTERVGRTEVGQHTVGTQMANQSAVAVVFDSRISGLERRLSAMHQAAETPTMVRLSNEVARLDIELRTELAKAVNHVAALAQRTPAYTNGSRNGSGLASPDIDLRVETAAIDS